MCVVYGFISLCNLQEEKTSDSSNRVGTCGLIRKLLLKKLLFNLDYSDPNSSCVPCTIFSLFLFPST